MAQRQPSDHAAGEGQSNSAEPSLPEQQCGAGIDVATLQHGDALPRR